MAGRSGLVLLFLLTEKVEVELNGVVGCLYGVVGLQL